MAVGLAQAAAGEGWRARRVLTRRSRKDFLAIAASIIAPLPCSPASPLWALGEVPNFAPAP